MMFLYNQNESAMLLIVRAGLERQTVHIFAEILKDCKKLFSIIIIIMIVVIIIIIG